MTTSNKGSKWYGIHFDLEKGWFGLSKVRHSPKINTMWIKYLSIQNQSR